jgi:hypothetical protein
MNAWNHLPNAHHIDRVLESAKSHLEIWSTPWDAVRNRDAAHNEAWYAATDAAWDVARNADRGVATVAARGAMYDAVKALIAYDDASKYLDMPVDQLRVWAILSEEPAAILLIPAVIAFERIRESECV